MIKQHCSVAGSRAQRDVERMIRASIPTFLCSPCIAFHPCGTVYHIALHALSTSKNQSHRRKRGVMISEMATMRFRHSSSTSVRPKSCVTGPVFTGQATQPSHQLTGRATQPRTGHLTQFSERGESLFLASSTEFFRYSFFPYKLYR